MGDGDLERRLRQALQRRLVRAGYSLYPEQCDVSLNIAWSISEGDFRSVRVAMRDATDKLIAPIVLSFSADEMPTFDTDRLATTIVNRMNDSVPLAAFSRRNAPAPTESAAISISATGVVIRRTATFVPQIIDANAVKATFAALADARVDVTIEPHAQWYSVVQAFDVLRMTGHAHTRVHSRQDIAEIDITGAETWRKGTWLALDISPADIVGSWRTDRSCETAPPSFAAESQSMDALTANLDNCASGCLERLILGGTSTDSAPYVDAMVVASHKLQAAVAVDVHGVSRPVARCGTATDALSAVFENAKGALRSCASKYHGAMRATIQVGAEGVVESVVVLFLDEPSVPDDVKTCAAKELERIKFPPDRHGRIVHVFDL